MPEQQKSNFLAHITPDRSNYISQGIARLQAMPELERQKLLESFRDVLRFCPSGNKENTQPLSEAERQQIEKTLNRFAGLSPLERDQCIRSFQKFALMSDEERQQFSKRRALEAADTHGAQPVEGPGGKPQFAPPHATGLVPAGRNT